MNIKSMAVWMGPILGAIIAALALKAAAVPTRVSVLETRMNAADKRMDDLQSDIHDIAEYVRSQK